MDLKPPTVAETAQILGQHHDEIVAAWRMEAGKLLRKLHLDNATLTDHIPTLVRDIIRSLQAGEDGSHTTQSSLGSSALHGMQRFNDGLDVIEVVGEYNLLRVAFLTVAERHGLVVIGEIARIINHRIDEAARLAVAAFVSHAEMQREKQSEEHLAFLTHDLRTPLNAVSLLVEELKCVLDETILARNAEIFQGLNRNLQRLSQLIQEVLDKQVRSLGSENVFQPQVRRFDLWPFVQQIIGDMQAAAAKSNTNVINQVPRDLMLCADAELIARVFQNLFGNAFQYAPAGRVVVSASVNEGEITCSVRDNGAGIPSEMLDKVFDKLVTDGDKDGTGLGLAIVKQVVEAHRGVVRVESTLGQGACFSFTLPLIAES
jgi:two-component system phosphate regulon sensor histidine kinase PhoR